jgi:putative membrane protein
MIVRKFLMMVFAALVMVSCTPKEKTADSNEVAEEANEEKFEDKKDEKDAEFVADVVASNYAEIELAKLASTRSDNAQVKEVARMLEDDHNKLLTELQAFAGTKAITVPTEPKDDAKKKIEDLTKEEDIKDFNKEWCKEMADKHEKTIEKFEDRAEKTADADLKIWITQTLPHLRTHLDKVKACEESLKNSK